jgi:hypothetical protein
MKKFLFFAAALIGAASANAQTQIDGIWYLIDTVKNTATVVHGPDEEPYAGRLIIPGKFERYDANYNSVEYTVTAIGDSAFVNCQKLTGITIPQTVDTIGIAVTIGSDYIREVKFEDGETPIFATEGSFQGAAPFTSTYLYLGRNVGSGEGMPVFHTWSGVQNVVIGETVTALPPAFCPYCRELQTVQINTDFVLEPGPRTFAFLEEDKPQPDAKAITIYVPKGMGKAYQAHTFWGRFTVQEMDEEKQYGIKFVDDSFDFREGGLYYQLRQEENTGRPYLAVVMPQVWYLNPDGSYVSQWSSEYPYKQTSIVIPDSLTFYKDGSPFSGSRLAVEAVGEYCFRRASKLAYLQIPNTVWQFGTEAIEYTDKLHSLTIPESVTEVGWLAFARSGLKEVVIPASSSNWLTSDAAFQDNENLVKATFANGTTAIQDRIFFGCTALRTIIIPDEVEYIGPGAFAACEALTEIKLPASLKVLNNRLFRGCPLRELEIPAGVEEIEGSALLATNIGHITVNPANKVFDSRDNCNAIIRTKDNTLITATNGAFIPASVDSIEQEAFVELEGIRSLTLPENIKHIAEYSFLSLTSLTLITSYIEKPAGVLAADAFGNDYGDTYNDVTLYVPYGTLAAYRADKEWNRFRNIVEMTDETKPASVEDIEPLAEEGAVTVADMPAGTDLTNAVVADLYITCDTLNGDHYDADEKAIVFTTVVDKVMLENILANPLISDVIRNNFSGMIMELPAGQGTISITVKTAGDHLLGVMIGDKMLEFEQLVKGIVEIPYELAAAARIYLYGFISTEEPNAAPTKHMPSHLAAKRAKADEPAQGAVSIYGASWKVGLPAALEEVSQEPKAKSQKLIRDGQLYILRDGKTYNAQGAEIK